MNGLLVFLTRSNTIWLDCEAVLERILINPLSAADQCTTIGQLEVLVSAITNCFEYILPGLDCGRTTLFYDPLLDSRPILAGEDVVVSISRLGGKRGPDIRKKWFLYTKNRSRKLLIDHCQVSLAVPGTEGAYISGEFHKNFLVEGYALLSLGGNPILESGKISLRSGAGVDMEVINAWSIDSVVSLFPQYEASPKHSAEPYFDTKRGEPVAPMQLNASEAQGLLIQSVRHGDDYWGWHKERRKFYRFKPTRGNVYHGFEVRENEVPANVIARISD